MPRLTAVTFLAGTLACTPPPPAPTQPEPARATEQAERATPETEEPLDAEYLAHQADVQRVTDEIIAAVGAARGLSVDKQVEVKLISHDGVRDFVKEALYEDMTPDELQLLARIESSLGVLPVGAQGEAVLLDLYEQGVLGIYDHHKKTLLIGDFVDKAVLGHVIGHEIAHGLQDMHFDLERLQKPVKGQSDFDAARTFLVEGGAEAGYLAYVHKDDGIAGVSGPVLDIISDRNLGVDENLTPYPILARMLQMPYGDGTATIVALAQQEGWKAIDALYDELPSTTEQMMHLDKLQKREPAKVITVDSAVLLANLAEHEVTWEDNIGEAALLAMLAEVEDTRAARKAAAGWGGDRFVALDKKVNPDAAPIVVGLIAWDSDKDAKEFEPAFRAYLEEKKSGNYLIERKRDRVLFATHTGTLEPKTVSKAGWKAFSVSKAKAGKKAKN
jgi:hypothetical protein